MLSLQTTIGRECNLFDIGPEHAEQIVVNAPILSQRKLRQLIGPGPCMFADRYAFIDLNAPETESLPQALDRICAEAEQAAVKVSEPWRYGVALRYPNLPVTPCRCRRQRLLEPRIATSGY